MNVGINIISYRMNRMNVLCVERQRQDFILKAEGKSLSALCVTSRSCSRDGIENLLLIRWDFVEIDMLSIEQGRIVGDGVVRVQRMVLIVLKAEDELARNACT